MPRQSSDTLPKYLNRRGDTGAYRHQRRIPIAPVNLLRFFPGYEKQGSIVAPLNTADRKVAERLNQHATVYTTELLRRADEDGETFAKEGIQAWFQHLVKKGHPPPWIRPPNTLDSIANSWAHDELDYFVDDPSPERDHWFHNEAEVLESIRKFAPDQYPGITPTIDESGWSELSRKGWQLFEEHLEAREAHRQKLANYSESIRLGRKEPNRDDTVPTKSVATSSPASARQYAPIDRVENPLLSQLVTEWAEKTQPGEKYLNSEVRRNVAAFEIIVGRIGIVDIKKHHVRKYREAISKLPRDQDIIKMGFKRDYNIVDVLEHIESVDMSPIKKLSSATVNKKITAVSTIISFAMDEYDLSGNPFSRMSIREKMKIRKRVDPTPDDLRLLFGSPLYRGCESLRARHKPGRVVVRDALFWIPLLALWTGARLEELGQLRCSDVRVADGIDFLSITILSDKEEADHRKQLKNESSVRDVPIHPELTKIGFLAYVNQQRVAGHTRLFPELTANKYGRLTQALSTKYARYRRKIGLTDPGKPAHAFRHLFKSACRAAVLSEDLHDALTGHAGFGQGRRYGSAGFPLQVKAEAINKITHAVDLSHLYLQNPQAQ